MKLLHIILGILLFAVFVTTGQYMRADYPDKAAMDQMLRMLMRSRHIYILFAGLIHLSIGTYFQFSPEPGRRVIQYAGSAVLLVSAALLVWAFIAESYYLHAASDLSRFGIYGLLGGVVLHVIGGWQRRAS